MVVNIESNYFNHDLPVSNAGPVRRTSQVRRAERKKQCLTIGLLNNMAGPAFKATERQFLTLLDAASEGIPIHASFYRLPGLSRAEAGGSRFSSHYASVEALWDTHLDGLIVTGREPKTPDLRDEPYWHSFTHVLDWARNNTHSTVWSCLAAHAAVLHMDGIQRIKAESKNFGVFDCLLESAHPLTQGIASRFGIPHSRWNGIERNRLLDSGYRILSSTTEGSIDAFAKQEKSLFVFFQGHPEYDTDTLMREYRRDVSRFVRGETASHPLLPKNYFDARTERTLTEFRQRAVSNPNIQILDHVVATLESAKIENMWRTSATGVYRNWLQFIAAQKRQAHYKVHSEPVLPEAQSA
jgi:homoserine O-succinyltransferase